MIRKRAAGKNEVKEVTRKNFSRLILLFIISAFAYSAVVYKLFDTQIRKHSEYAARYSEQSKKKITVHAPKGNIYDRNYSKLAENIGINYAFGVNTRVVSGIGDLAGRISSVTGTDKQKYAAILSSRDGFVWVDTKLTEKQRGDIYSVLTDREKSAAAFRSTPNRVYPNNRLAGQIIGYTDIDGKGRSGIEREFEGQLNGTDGWEYVHQDGRLNKYYGTEINRKEPVPGNSIVLTIDDDYQRITEDELAKAVVKWSAQKGVAIVMEPKSGEILAMASYPDYDPNRTGDFDAFAMKNKAVTDVYEPGSTLKGISAAILFEEGQVDEEEVFFCSNDGYAIGSRKIKDSHKNENEHMSFRDVIGQSSNIGTLQAMMRVDRNTHYEYLRDFGFGNRTEIELTGEVSGRLLKVREWSQTTQPTMSFGQGLTVTPLQLITAYCAIANGGELVKPMIVKGIIDRDNRIVKKYESSKIRRVISEKTAERVRNLLRYVVTDGTGSNAEIEGLAAAGKTGTSQKVENGQYSRSHYDASFIGMVPYDDPALVCLVMIDSPRGCIYGGTVAAPAFRNIISRIYGTDSSKLIAKAKSGKGKLKEVPDMTGLSVAEAAGILESRKIKYKIVEGSDTVTHQSRPPYSLIRPDEQLVLYSGKRVGDVSADLGTVPDVTGLALREGVKLLLGSGIEPVVTGKGNIVGQSEIHTAPDGTARSCSLFCRQVTPDKIKNSARL